MPIRWTPCSPPRRPSWATSRRPTTSPGYDIFTNFSADYIGPNVVLQGNGLTLVHVPGVQVAELDAWRSVSVLLSPGANWHIDGFAGATPTEAQFQSVLGALSALWISGETHNGI